MTQNLPVKTERINSQLNESKYQPAGFKRVKQRIHIARRWSPCGATTIDGAEARPARGTIRSMGAVVVKEVEEEEVEEEGEEELRVGTSLRRGGVSITTGTTTGSVAVSGEAMRVRRWSGVAEEEVEGV